MMPSEGPVCLAALSAPTPLWRAADLLLREAAAVWLHAVSTLQHRRCTGTHPAHPQSTPEDTLPASYDSALYDLLSVYTLIYNYHPWI